ncbi:uncharacterized protein LOC141552709 [Sminthopsis crassicaudata]|uniref:uncharacterized protein LOC141552709 n=1 Tax=Sminthopsis crassicaudata TaxID=9301 RepID=UPI003D69841C
MATKATGLGSEVWRLLGRTLFGSRKPAFSSRGSHSHFAFLNFPSFLSPLGRDSVTSPTPQGQNASTSPAPRAPRLQRKPRNLQRSGPHRKLGWECFGAGPATPEVVLVVLRQACPGCVSRCSGFVMAQATCRLPTFLILSPNPRDYGRGELQIADSAAVRNPGRESCAPQRPGWEAAEARRGGLWLRDSAGLLPLASVRSSCIPLNVSPHPYLLLLSAPSSGVLSWPPSFLPLESVTFPSRPRPCFASLRCTEITGWLSPQSPL